MIYCLTCCIKAIFLQLRRYRTYVEVLGARILANGEDAEMVDSIMVVQQQPTMTVVAGSFMTERDVNGGDAQLNSPSSDRTDGDSVISAGSSSRTPTNRYSYRAAIYENPQDIG